MEPDPNKSQSNEASDNVTQLVDQLNETTSDKSWVFELLGSPQPAVEVLNENKDILVILSIDKQTNKPTLDCDTFMNGVNREMAVKKSLVKSINRIYIQEEKATLWSAVGQKAITRSRTEKVTEFENCEYSKQASSKCKLPEGIKELIWKCIEPKINEQMTNATRDEIQRFYLPEKVIQELAPEEKDKEPPICDFFKEAKPKSVSSTCSDEMTKYLKEKLSTMRDQIVKSGKQKETDVFEKSMELAGNEMWELIKKTAEDFTIQPPFFINGFIKANITMPEQYGSPIAE